MTAARRRAVLEIMGPWVAVYPHLGACVPALNEVMADAVAQAVKERDTEAKRVIARYIDTIQQQAEEITRLRAALHAMGDAMEAGEYGVAWQIRNETLRETGVHDG